MMGAALRRKGLTSKEAGIAAEQPGVCLVTQPILKDDLEKIRYVSIDMRLFEGRYKSNHSFSLFFLSKV